MTPPGAGGAPPAKMKPGVKYALFGCGCLALIGAGGVIFALASGGVASYMAKKATTPGGADCVAAAACCKKMLAKSGQTDMSSCDNLKTAPAIACAEALKTYKRSAPALGLTCP